MGDLLISMVMWIGGAVLGLALVVFVYTKIRGSSGSSSGVISNGGHKIFLVLLPRELPNQKEGAGSDAKSELESIRSQISHAESIIASVGGLKAPGGGLFGKSKIADPQTFAFELVAHEGLISFYVAVPKGLLDYFLQQVRSVYKNIELEEIDDYNIFSPTGVIKATYIKQDGKGFLPIKTYKEFDGDPFDNLTNVLSKLDPSESAAIQVIMRSAPSTWRQSGKQLIKRIKKGEGLEPESKNPLAAVASGAGTMLKDSIGVNSEKKEIETPKKQEMALSKKEEELVKMIEDKSAKAGLDVNIRIVVSTASDERGDLILDNIVNNFSQYNIYEYGNSLVKSSEKLDKLLNGFIHRSLNVKKKVVFNTEELISIIHFPLPTTATPNIHWLTSRKAPAPVNLPEEGVTLGVNKYRGEEKVVHISDWDRARHLYVIGTTGVGKSVLSQHIALQDIELGRGVGVIDPHGDFVEYLLENMPKERFDDVVYFNPADMDYPVGLNMLEAKDTHEKDFVAQEMIQIFYKLVTDPSMIGPMFEHYMRNAMLTLMADQKNPGTITEIPRIFTDDKYRKSLMPNVTDPVVRAFWEKEMAQTSAQSKSEMLGYLVSKVGRFIENEMMRNIIGQPRSSINFKDVLSEEKILLVNLSKGKIGEINSTLLGLIVVSKMQAAAFAQAELPEDQRKPFYLFIDEFQNYTTDSIAIILSEARKYKLSLTMAHQYLGQLVKNGDSSIRDAVLGNVGTMASFRIGVEDAPTIAQQMAPVFSEYDLVNMEKYNVAIKMLVNNTVQRAFSMATYPPREGDRKKAELLKELSSRKYGRPRKIVEEEIMERSQLGDVVKKADRGPLEATL